MTKAYKRPSADIPNYDGCCSAASTKLPFVHVGRFSQGRVAKHAGRGKIAANLWTGLLKSSACKCKYPIQNTFAVNWSEL